MACTIKGTGTGQVILSGGGVPDSIEFQYKMAKELLHSAGRLTNGAGPIEQRLDKLYRCSLLKVPLYLNDKFTPIRELAVERLKRGR